MNSAAKVTPSPAEHQNGQKTSKPRENWNESLFDRSKGPFKNPWSKNVLKKPTGERSSHRCAKEAKGRKVKKQNGAEDFHVEGVWLLCMRYGSQFTSSYNNHRNKWATCHGIACNPVGCHHFMV